MLPVFLTEGNAILSRATRLSSLEITAGMVSRGIEETVTVTHDLSSKRNSAPALFWVARGVAPTSNIAGRTKERGNNWSHLLLFAFQMLEFIKKCEKKVRPSRFYFKACKKCTRNVEV